MTKLLLLLSVLLIAGCVSASLSGKGVQASNLVYGSFQANEINAQVNTNVP